MKALILNRRDIKNPDGGGAEVYTHEAAKGLKERGWDVTVFSSIYKNAPADEIIDGIKYHREGNEFAVHFKGFLYARRRYKDFDVIIDEFNGTGFFTFFLPKSILLIHQLYKEFWMRALGPAGILPYLIEPIMLKRYRNRPAITVSESTKKDLESLGFKDVEIVMNALGNAVLDELPVKEDRPTMLFLGRLKATKRPEDAIEIYKLVKAEIDDARLWIIGSGPMEAELKEKAKGLDGVRFFGWLGNEKKFEMLGRSHVLIVPSVREGFGINVIEAASQGTPAVGYDIHGLRDSIKDRQTGYLARGVKDAAEKTVELLRDNTLYEKLADNCLEYARGFNWRSRAEEFYRAVGRIADKYRDSSRSLPK